jgi:hypothetical protein
VVLVRKEALSRGQKIESLRIVRKDTSMLLAHYAQELFYLLNLARRLTTLPALLNPARNNLNPARAER